MEIPLGDEYKLRPIAFGDEVSIARYANNRKVWINLRDVFPHPYTVADATAYITAQVNDPRVGAFAIARGNEAIGGIGLHPGAGVDRISAEIGYWLGEPFWGKGIATRAVKAACTFGFAEMGLWRIFATVYEWNPASMRVLEKAGFVREGRMRNAVIKDGKVIDAFLYALVRAGAPT